MGYTNVAHCTSLSRFCWITEKLLSHRLAERFFPKLQAH
jgi:hypothetical protein